MSRARVEMARHLDGPMVVRPKAGSAGERRVEVSGRVKTDGLLGPQEAVVYAVRLVAGAGYAEYYTAPETHWIDLK